MCPFVYASQLNVSIIHVLWIYRTLHSTEHSHPSTYPSTPTQARILAPLPKHVPKSVPSVHYKQHCKNCLITSTIFISSDTRWLTSQLNIGVVPNLTFATTRRLVISLKFSRHLSNSLTFPGFPDKWPPSNFTLPLQEIRVHHALVYTMNNEISELHITKCSSVAKTRESLRCSQHFSTHSVDIICTPIPTAIWNIPILSSALTDSLQIYTAHSFQRQILRRRLPNSAAHRGEFLEFHGSPWPHILEYTVPTSAQLYTYN